MKSERTTFPDVDAYIAFFPTDVQKVLQKVRACVRKAAPGAVEKISYGIPTLYLNGNLVHFAAFKAHIGFYPGAAGIEHFQSELSAYETSKGAIRFLLSQPMPFPLIERITRYRAAENAKPRGNPRKK